MNTLVFVESAEGKIKKTSLEAVAYAKAMGQSVIALVVGTLEDSSIAQIGKAGANKVLHANDSRLNQAIVQAYSAAICQAMQAESAKTLVLANTSLGTPIAARVAARLNASIATNVTELPETTAGFVVKKSIYTGKAFSKIDLKNDYKVIAIKKNAAEAKSDGAEVAATAFTPQLNDSDFSVKILSTEKASGEISLPEANVVVSGGRGMKGPEHWQPIEDLAKLLGGATGCSKPVSDIGWRPHHEHVGQTGVKVSPQLYIAVGISGAIQHLAGVNSSKCIVVINKDPEAPFFKAADYGIVGDAFDVLPKLIDAVKAAK